MGWTCDDTVASAVRCVFDPTTLDYLGLLLQGVWFAAAAVIGVAAIVAAMQFFRRV